MTAIRPYQSLDRTHFWKTGVAEVVFDEGFQRLWKPKFPISRDTKILTLGSCFAQHISRWLLSNGYGWQDKEPAPENMPVQDYQDQGYGQYSFRTGNVYTVAQLRQWLELALHGKSLAQDYIEADGRFFDPLRPQIPCHGYDSHALLQVDRQRTLDAMVSGFREADLFIFTLGLTESWVSVDGQVHPVCPGTIRGQFNPNLHVFQNHDYASIRDDMRWIVGELKRINPDLRILLTVSPVPLTATATEMHVLVATSYSKSVLRAVAGDLAHAEPDIDYFPSYELICGAPTRSRFFEINLRSVKEEGVAFVMRHFSAGLSGAWQQATPPILTARMQTQEDIACEEILLESWQSKEESDEQAAICLIGDSHMGMLSKSLAKRKIPHAGGMIMNGSAWTSNLLHLDKVEYFVPLEDVAARERWQQTLPFFQGAGKGGPSQKLVVSNLCMQTHRSVSHFFQWLGNRALNEDLFYEHFFEQNLAKLSLLKSMADTPGVSVVLVTDPPTQAIDSSVASNIHCWEYYDDMAEKVLKHLGYRVFHARRHFQACGFDPQYHSPTVFADGSRDWFHGSEGYYDVLSEALLDWAKQEGC